MNGKAGRNSRGSAAAEGARREVFARNQERIRRMGGALRAHFEALETQALDRAFLSTERSAPLHPLLHRETAEPL